MRMELQSAVERPLIVTAPHKNGAIDTNATGPTVPNVLTTNTVGLLCRRTKPHNVTHATTTAIVWGMVNNCVNSVATVMELITSGAVPVFWIVSIRTESCPTATFPNGSVAGWVGVFANSYVFGVGNRRRDGSQCENNLCL